MEDETSVAPEKWTGEQRVKLVSVPVGTTGANHKSVDMKSFYAGASTAGATFTLSVWKQVIVDPSGEDGRLHRDRPWLRQLPDPGIQILPRRVDLALP